jgi:LPS export ABC transporter permease LptG/LPS export ABC transporter permease LptF
MSKSRRIGLGRRLGRTLHRYVAWELVRPTVLAFGGLTVLLLTAELFGFSDLVINRGFGFGAILELMLFKVIILASRTLPFATLVGTLVGLGRLKTDLEILAIQASGVSRRQFVGPVLTFAAAMTSIGLMLALFGAPWASASLSALEQGMARDNPTTLLRAGETYTFGATRILAREVSSGGDQLSGVLLWTPAQADKPGTTFLDGQTIFAQRAEVQSKSNGKTQLILSNGLTLSPIRGTGGSTRFDTLWTSLEQTAAEPSSLGHEEKKANLQHVSLQRLTALGWTTESPSQSPGVQDAQYARLAQAEFHRRFSSPLASLVLGLLATPIALLSRTFSRAAGGVSGLVITVVYYGLVQFGDGLAQAGVVSPGLGVWLPNILVGAIALLLLWGNGNNSRLHWRGQNSRQQTEPSVPSSSNGVKRYVLQRYVARSYAYMLALSFGFLFTGYFLVDMLERLQWFARYQAEFSEIIRFYCARAPLLASRMVPMSLLLATALTVGILSLNKELIGMRACGVSVVHALSPVLLIPAFIAPAYLFLTEAIVPRTNAWADWLKITEIKPQANHTRLQPLAIWHQNGKLYHTRQLDTVNKEAQDISIFELDAEGLPTSRTDAHTARHIGDGVWELADPIRLLISDTSFELAPTSPHIQLGTEPKVQVDTMHLNARQLSQTIHDTEASGYDATAYRVAFHMKLAAPLMCLLLPAVVLFFAVGGPPFPSPALTILASCGIGIGSILLSDIFSSLGYGDFVPPGLAGWGPSSVLVILVAVFAVRSQGETWPSFRLPQFFKLLRPAQLPSRPALVPSPFVVPSAAQKTVETINSTESTPPTRAKRKGRKPKKKANR